MSKIIVPLLFVLSCFFVLCHGIEDCGSVVGNMVKLTITGCDDPDKRCILHRDSNVTMTMEFNLKEDVKTVTAKVYGVVLDVPIPFALPNPDGCKESGLSCPLKAGGPYTYVSVMPVEKKYPKVTVDVKWELKNEKDQNILCTLIPAKIQ